MPSVSTVKSSGLKSQRGIGGIDDPAGTPSGAWMPGSRNGRGTPVTTACRMPLLVPVAVGSLVLPWVGPATVTLAATRMPSRRSS